MRAFIGVEFPREIKNKIIEAQNYIKCRSTAGRWKYIDNFHLTLKFLGEVSNEQVNTIYNNMKESMVYANGFHVTSGGLGYFNGDNCFRVIYLKINDSNNRLDDIYELVEDSCVRASIKPEKRKYTPHVTIAQDVKLIGSFNDLFEYKQVQGIDIPVNEVSIIMSEQRENKRIYTPIRTIKLKGETHENNPDQRYY